MARKKILLLGATGASGLVTLSRALEADAEVIVYARNPSKIPTSARENPNLTIIQGSLDDTEALTAAIARKPDAIISLLGPATSDMVTYMKPWDRSTIFADTYRVIIEAMRANGVRRILAMGTLSIPEPKDRFSFLTAALVWVVYLMVHNAWHNIIYIGKTFDNAPPEIDWTVYRLGMISDGDYQAVADGYIGDGKTTSGVRRSELADWLVSQALSDEPHWVREKPVVSSAAKSK